jgi:uncharacterized protein YybS (DUF2232 family)
LIEKTGVGGVDQVERKPEGVKIYQYVFLLTLVLILPGVNVFCPLFVFLYLYGFGLKLGNRIILQGVLLATGISYFFGSVSIVFFSLTLLPSGYMIANGAGKSEELLITGLKGIATLGICWLLFWGGLVIADDGFSYSNIVHSLQEGVELKQEMYRHNDSIPVDTLVVLDQMLNQTKELFPKILPAILGSFIIINVWLTMVLGNRVALKYWKKSPWIEFKFWKIPEKFIWALIGSAVLALIPVEPSRTIGMNLLIMVSVLFVFQGLAILVYFFNKWKMPFIIRLFLYTIAVIQSPGTILLLVIGVMDIWLDLRRINSDPNLLL